MKERRKRFAALIAAFCLALLLPVPAVRAEDGNGYTYIAPTLSKSADPYDPEKPWITSGLRIGTTAITQRGLGEQEIDEIVDIMDAVVKNPEDEANLKECRARSEALIANFPLYPAGAFED